MLVRLDWRRYRVLLAIALGWAAYLVHAWHGTPAAWAMALAIPAGLLVFVANSRIVLTDESLIVWRGLFRTEFAVADLRLVEVKSFPSAWEARFHDTELPYPRLRASAFHYRAPELRALLERLAAVKPGVVQDLALAR